ncbi:MAG: hypothetical protein ACOX0L_05585 [Natronincolaceae bacterium]
MKFMKKIKVTSLLLVVVLLMGCTPEQPMATEGPESPAAEKVSHQEEVEEIKLEDLEYFLPELQEELDAIDEMTTEKAAEVFTEHRKQGTLGRLGLVYYINDLVNEGLAEAEDNEVTIREGAKAAVVSSKYDLPFSVVNPYTGRIYGELYADDLEYFAPVEGSMEIEILKRPLNERRFVPYRNYFDFLEDGTEGEALVIYTEAWNLIHTQLIDVDNLSDARYYFIPETTIRNEFGSYTTRGMLVNRWPEDIDDDYKEIVGDLAGDGNFYKHPTTFIYKITNEGDFAITHMTVSVEEEYMENLGPDYDNSTDLQPTFIKVLLNDFIKQQEKLQEAQGLEN